MGNRVWFDWIQFLPTVSWYIYIGRKREFVGARNKTPGHAYRGKASRSFSQNLFLSYPIILKFCTEYGSITVVLCAKLWKDWTTKTDVTDERDYEKVEFKMSFGRMSYIAQAQAGHWKVVHTEGMVSRGLLLGRGAINCTNGQAITPFIHFNAQIRYVK